MKERIEQFLLSEKISPAEFADKIGVQRSSMSHILNGRNFPSASFIQKMLSAYPDLNARWLLIGQGNIYLTGGRSAITTVQPPVVPAESASGPPVISREKEPAGGKGTESITIPETPGSALKESSRPDADYGSEHSEGISGKAPDMPAAPHVVAEISIPAPEPKTIPDRQNGREIEQVLLFHTDKTFTVYRPS